MNPPNLKIAVLGWGSLIANPNGDASTGQRPLRIAGVFHPSGPVLPLEFSRISNDGRLTLVVDPRNGTMCETLYAMSAMPNLDSATQNLAEREGTPLRHVHFVARGEDHTDDSIHRSISEWRVKNQLSAVIWTGLPPKFSFHHFTEFSTEAAIAYLKSLTGETRKKSLNYIATAPATIQTPLRRMAKEVFGI